MEELKKDLAELEALMVPEAIQNLDDEEIENLKEMLEKIKDRLIGLDYEN